jgi:hypothetical protein
MAFVVMPAVLENRYPNRVERIDAISKCLKALDVDEPKPAKLRSDCEREGVQLGDVSTNKKKDAEVERLKDEATDVQRPMLGTTYLLLAGLFVLCLLYVVPSTVATGQTLGKKLRQVWLVRVDGSKVRLGGAIAHYAVPVAVAIAIPQIGVIIALGMVLWSLRDRNGQGVHDKLARTVVVDVPPDGAKEDR